MAAVEKYQDQVSKKRECRSAGCSLPAGLESEGTRQIPNTRRREKSISETKAEQVNYISLRHHGAKKGPRSRISVEASPYLVVCSEVFRYSVDSGVG